MQDYVKDNSSSNGCVAITVKLDGGGIKTSYTPVDGGIDVSLRRIGGVETDTTMVGGIGTQARNLNVRLSVSFALLCRSGSGEWEYLFVHEGQLYDVENEKILVRRDKNGL